MQAPWYTTTDPQNVANLQGFITREANNLELDRTIATRAKRGNVIIFGFELTVIPGPEQPDTFLN